MPKLILENVGNLIDATTAATTINNNSAKIVEAVEDTLSRTNKTPSQMEAPLDMNSMQIINLPVPATNTSALRLQDLIDFNDNGTITNLPIGGDTNQVLTKNSDVDYDISWKDPALNLTAGTNITVTGDNVISTVSDPTFTSVETPTLINTGTLTLPTSNDTLVGRNTTDTLTNKTIDASQLTGTVSTSRLPALTGEVTAPVGTGVTTIANLSSVMDRVFGSTEGQVLYRSDTAWEALSIGQDGQVLTSISSNPAWATPFRRVLSGNLTLYVRTDGNDSNNGLTNSSAGAFRTVQAAINKAANYDLDIYNITISVTSSDATTGTAKVNGPWVGAGTVILQGNTTTPSSTPLSSTSNPVILVDGGGRLTVRGFKLSNTSLFCIQARNGDITIDGNMEYGSCTIAHLYTNRTGSITVTGSYTISGGSGSHMASLGSLVNTASTITLTGTPAFTQFAYATRGGFLNSQDNTFSGSATGSRYLVEYLGVLYTNGGGATYFPGSTAGSGGTTTGGGIYI